MHLRLTIEKGGGDESRAESIVLGPEGGTLGRGSRCDLVLPDPDCFVSSEHAEIAFENGQFILTDKSTNGTYHNRPDQLVGRGRKQHLASGERLYIGDFVLRVDLEDDSEGESPVTGSDAQAADSASKLPDDWDAGISELPWEQAAGRFDDTAEPDGEDDEPPEPGNQSPEREYFAAPSARRSESHLIPDDWDDFLTGFEPADQSGEDAVSESARSPAQVRSVDQVPEMPPSPDRSPPPERPQPREASEPDRQPEVSRDSSKPELKADTDADAIYRLLETVTGGLMSLLHSRSEIKNEFRIEQTRFATTENNPLKFSPSADEALNRILGDSTESGFLTGTEAYHEAVDDLQAHQLALMAAVQQAIETAIAQFNPKQLEARLKKISPVSARTPGLREARCWRLFTSHYEEIAGQLHDDARKVFLREFADAYERAVRDIAVRRTGSKD